MKTATKFQRSDANPDIAAAMPFFPKRIKAVAPNQKTALRQWTWTVNTALGLIDHPNISLVLLDGRLLLLRLHRLST